MLLDSNKVMETRLCPSRGYSSYWEESGDEEMAVLPRHTKVVVTGNNRTKSVLVGLQGVVKKAVGLGGWHWLVLKNGVEVKLQRNALSVLEPPNGNEDDESYDFDDSSCGSDLGGKDKHHISSSVEFSMFSKSRIRYAKPWVPVASRKSSSLNSCRNVQPRSKIPQLGINLAKLGTNSLWRYCKSFKLANISSNLTKEQLISLVEPHFSSRRVDEVHVIVEFVRAAKKSRKNS